MEGGRGRNSVSHAHQDGATEYLWSAGRVSENCIGCHQYRTHGYEQKAGCRNSEGYPAICGEIRLVWTDDCATYHTKLYGIWGGVPAEKSLHQRRNYVHWKISGTVLSIRQIGCDQAWYRIHVEHPEWPCYDGIGFDHDRQADGCQHELSAGICGAIWMDETAVHWLGVYLYQQFSLLWGLWYTERWNPADDAAEHGSFWRHRSNLSYSSFG